jgi:hypothetical protein
MPSNEQQLDTGALPIFSQNFGHVVANLTDDRGLVSAELRMTCTSCGTLGPVNALEEYRAFIPPVTAATVVLSFDAGASPYLPNGIYVMRLVTQDTDGSRNIQEVKVKLSRNDPVCPNPYAVTTFKGDPNEGEKLTPGSADLIANGLTLGNEYRNAWWVISPSGVFSFRNLPGFNNLNVDRVSKTFNASGDWLFFGQLENVTTGCIHNIDSSVSVSNPRGTFSCA